MTGLVRRGGQGTLADGALLTWSVAEGSRGRRWRATRVRDGTLEHSLLLETDTDGRPARLEIDARGGLLTLHPSADRRVLHGNVVTPAGIRHVALGWGDDHELLVAGQPIVAMAAAHRLAPRIGVGEALERSAVVVGATLDPDLGTVRFEHRGQGQWIVTADGLEADLQIDGDGLPAGLDGAATWPLEA